MVIQDEALEFEVERIVRHRMQGRGRGRHLEYLVLWLGHDMSSATWEPAAGLGNAQERVRECSATLGER